MSLEAAFEFLRRALVIGGEAINNFHTTEAANVILQWAESTGGSVGVLCGNGTESVISQNCDR